MKKEAIGRVDWFKYVKSTEEKNNKSFHPLKNLMREKINLVFERFKECGKVGFIWDGYKENNIISDLLEKWDKYEKIEGFRFTDSYTVLKEMQTILGIEFKDVIDTVGVSYAYDLIKMTHLAGVLSYIQKVFKKNMSNNIKESGKLIFEIEDYHKLNKISQNFDREITDYKLHKDFKDLQEHISSQLKYIKRKHDGRDIEPIKNESKEGFVNSDNSESERVNPLNKPKKYPVKYYALYHFILIELGIEKIFEKNTNNQYSKKEIISFAEKKYNLKKGGGFYASFKNISESNKIAMAKEFGKGYKDKIINLSSNDSNVISLLKNYPN